MLRAKARRLISWRLLAAAALAVPALAQEPAAKEKSKDLYPDFLSMKEASREGKDYRVRFEDRKSSVTVFAIHGGNIEPGTSQGALAVAGSDWNYYLFECPRSFKKCRRLHVTASHFDDPAAVALATSSVLAVSVHGARDMVESVCVGGANAAKRASMVKSLTEAGIPANEPCRRLPGSGPRNIVNRSQQAGVQLEVSAPLCRKLEKDVSFRQAFGGAVRRGLEAP
ncbi:MAG: poly-gamma-glutamate hydrolase family protein [Elusimicrobia bacterium]|nr:poly-gamma-glutamate hydrolase family protein [Elusimicrobiota bacterium]